MIRTQRRRNKLVKKEEESISGDKVIREYSKTLGERRKQKRRKQTAK